MNLYIGNLSYNVKESDLRNVMEEYGTVASVKLITDRETRRSKGFAFVEMPDDAEANNVINNIFKGRGLAGYSPFAKTTASIVNNCSLLVDSSSFMSFLIPNL